MKKLQGAHQRKVGQEDPGAHGGGGTPEGGVQGPAPIQAGGGSERAPGPTQRSGGGRAELGGKEGRGHGLQRWSGGWRHGIPHLGVGVLCDGAEVHWARSFEQVSATPGGMG